ncbi:MAG TPA: YneF family protein [Bacilli bacterium]|nr:YneF family protein [Bacilli bacterium]
MFLISTGAFIGAVVGALLGGLVAGYFIAQAVFKNQLKKNPPINEKQIRVMLSSMGRKPSEAQVRSIMRSMQNEAGK